MLEEGGDMLELLGAVEARVVEVLHGQLAHQHVILEARHGPRREVTRGVRTPETPHIQCFGSGSMWIRIEMAPLDPDPGQSKKSETLSLKEHSPLC